MRTRADVEVVEPARMQDMHHARQRQRRLKLHTTQTVLRGCLRLAKTPVC